MAVLFSSGCYRAVIGLFRLRFILNIFGLLLVGSLPVNGQIGRPLKEDYYALPDTAEPVELFLAPKNTFLITATGIYKQERKEFLKKYAATARINCAAEDDSVFWLGTQAGLFRVNKKTYTSKLVSLPLENPQPRITTILKDYAGTVWVGAEAYGVYQFINNTFEKVLGAFPVNAGRATPDSSVWIGTHTGLYRYQQQKWVRYNEEGVSNYEIPDNIVDKLLVDNNRNLWVVLSEGLTVFEAQSPTSPGHGHVPAVKFIGKPQNPVYSVVYVKQRGYVFATGMGLLFLPDQNSQAGHLESLEATGASDVVQNKSMLHSVTISSGKNNLADFSQARLLKADKNNLWLVGQHGIKVLPLKEVAKLLPEAKVKKL